MKRAKLSMKSPRISRRPSPRLTQHATQKLPPHLVIPRHSQQLFTSTSTQSTAPRYATGLRSSNSEKNLKSSAYPHKLQLDIIHYDEKTSVTLRLGRSLDADDDSDDDERDKRHYKYGMGHDSEKVHYERGDREGGGLDRVENDLDDENDVADAFLIESSLLVVIFTFILCEAGVFLKSSSMFFTGTLYHILFSMLLTLIIIKLPLELTSIIVALLFFTMILTIIYRISLEQEN